MQGSEFNPYKVGVALKGDDFTAACSCPYDWEGYCKHIVAALLTYMSGNGGNGGDIETGTPIEDLLADMSADDLRTLALLLGRRRSLGWSKLWMRSAQERKIKPPIVG